MKETEVLSGWTITETTVSIKHKYKSSLIHFGILCLRVHCRLAR